MKVVCRTNLDDVGREAWPKSLPAVPNVGDLIESGTVHRNQNTSPVCGMRVELEVVRVTWKQEQELTSKGWEDTGCWYPEIEMHIPKNRFMCITDWRNWYDYISGRISQEIYQMRIEKERKVQEGLRSIGRMNARSGV